MAGAAAAVPFAAVRSALAEPEEPSVIAQRIAGVVGEYEAQGFHRTATPADFSSAEWLAGQIDDTGLTPALEAFSVERVDPVTNVLVAGGRRIEGIPLFDGAFTRPEGLEGRLGDAGSDADIALVETAVNAAGAGALGDARRAGRYKAIVAITRGRRPGLCPSNADSFVQPFGPPVLQVSSEDGAALRERASRGERVTVIANVDRAAAVAANVTSSIAGSDASLAPVVVMTPRSGWYTCASERGGGIACWLEMMRGLREPRPRRTILFVASSGHELGHLGINAFIDRRAGIVKKAVGWLHLGANIGAATEAANTIQASDDEFDRRLTEAMSGAGLQVDRRTPRGRVPGGEAEAVHRGGGRYVSIIGGNALFHNPEDKGPQAIDPAAIARFSGACTAFVRALASA
jgi:hypothetical protein